MKIYGKLLALCVSVWGATAFSVQSSKARASSVSLHAFNSDIPPYGEQQRGMRSGMQQQQRGGQRQQLGNRVPGRGNVPRVQEDIGTSSGNLAQTGQRRTSGGRDVTEIFDSLPAMTVQGGALRTWSFDAPEVERVQVLMKTDGRPLNANVDLWQGPDNAPQKMGVYVEDGYMRTFCAVIETPRGSNAIAIRNTATVEFPLECAIEPADGRSGLGGAERTLLSQMARRTIPGGNVPRIIQGGAVHTIPFESAVQSVEVLLQTDGRPLNARIEMLQGPNNNKQVIELYCEDGMERPFFAIFETPGVGNVIRIVNTATVEFPLTASVEPFLVDPTGNVGRGSGYIHGRSTGGPL